MAIFNNIKQSISNRKLEPTIIETNVEDFTKSVRYNYSDIKGFSAYMIDNVPGFTNTSKSKNATLAIMNNFFSRDENPIILNQLSKYVLSNIDYKSKSSSPDKIPFAIGYNQKSRELWLVGEKSSLTIKSDGKGTYEMESIKHPYSYCNETEIIKDIKINKGVAPITYARLEEQPDGTVDATYGETAAKDYAAIDGSSGYVVFASSSVTKKIDQSGFTEITGSKTDSFSLVYGTTRGNLIFSDLVDISIPHDQNPSGLMNLQVMLNRSKEEVFGKSKIENQDDSNIEQANEQ